MPQLIKADFHLHTYHSDNQDRMTPAEYVTRARELGYGALGFCDHHHNMNEEDWATLRDEVASLQSPDLLLTTGYEATWMAGHLCVLDKEEFNAGTIGQCMPQTWSPANLRILAHPDNNICAWHLPLPVGVQGVEVINGGQDPYSVRSSSPCNGLNTYRRYLALDHPVAAIAQSDCHQRMIFGRVWTGIVTPDEAQVRGAPFDRAAMHSALNGHHTIAVMGDLSVGVWAEGEDRAGPGETVRAGQKATLHWRVPPGTAVQVWLADRPLADFAPSNSGEGRYVTAHNGPHWLLCRRGLHWAVTSPVRVANLPGVTPEAQAQLRDHSVVQAAASRVQARIDWLRRLSTESPSTESPSTVWPVDAYVMWATRLLPRNWRGEDVAWSGVGDPVDWAMLRLNVMDATLNAVLADLVRAQHRAVMPPETTGAVIATAGEAVPAGAYRFTIDVPAQWDAWRVTDATGQELPAVITPTTGVRDPLHGPRRREQMEELLLWLWRGEIHEYRLHHVQLEITEEHVSLRADLWPAALEGSTAAPMAAVYPAEAERLRAVLAAPDLRRFDVHLRMPKRYVVVLKLDAPHADGFYPIVAKPLLPTDTAPPPADAAAVLMGPDALATDPSDETLICQVS